MFRRLWTALGYDYHNSPHEKCHETINNYIDEIRPRDGKKNFYGTFKLEGIPYLQFAIMNRDIDENHVDYLANIAKIKYENNASIHYDGEIILAIFNNMKEVYGIVIDGQHRLKAMEKLMEDEIIPKDLVVNVIVHRITSYQDGFDLIKRWNKDIKITGEQEYLKEILAKIDELEVNEKIKGLVRPYMDSTKFILKVKKLELWRKMDVDEFMRRLMEYNGKVKEEIKNCYERRNPNITQLKLILNFSGMSGDKVEKFNGIKYCLGIDTEYKYLELF